MSKHKRTEQSRTPKEYSQKQHEITRKLKLRVKSIKSTSGKESIQNAIKQIRKRKVQQQNNHTM